jgi:hypothetical protein
MLVAGGARCVIGLDDRERRRERRGEVILASAQVIDRITTRARRERRDQLRRKAGASDADPTP